MGNESPHPPDTYHDMYHIQTKNHAQLPGKRPNYGYTKDRLHPLHSYITGERNDPAYGNPGNAIVELVSLIRILL
ncbi:hypothetical protein L211DRAFT_118323 [Terfezia boudieri ATCC MYA-4762]|uniref:Uncharacterized protein n=1 Tax=Terfezia boudieri ATCC MYA-4762 TaxID=1051890 RepID=A0A3N4LRA5_9PEZI|nr:hypothetical protein L211DRAFT_118323 [Terfezia boudieri ATCC MYA-4762]